MIPPLKFPPIEPDTPFADHARFAWVDTTRHCFYLLTIFLVITNFYFLLTYLKSTNVSDSNDTKLDHIKVNWVFLCHTVHFLFNTPTFLQIYVLLSHMYLAVNSSIYRLIIWLYYEKKIISKPVKL